jgi:L-lactate dehydrogenase complex protein LldG
VSRELILDRVRRATTRAGDARPPEAPGWTRPWPPATDNAEQLIARFTAAAEALSAHVHRCPLDEAGSLVAGLAGEHRCATAALSGEAIVAASGADLALRMAGVAVATNPGRDGQLAADLGVTGVDAAFADTATLVLASTTERPRSTSLLPWVHIALVRPEQILDGLRSWRAGLPDSFEPAAPPRTLVTSAWTFVSGPSRTADIEQTLTLGAHGPGVLHVVITLAA